MLQDAVGGRRTHHPRRRFRDAGLLAAIASVVLAAGSQAAPAERAPAHKAAAEAPPPPHAIPATGELNAEDLIAIARQGGSAQVDAFTDSPTNIHAGRTFAAQAVQQIVSYDIATHTLVVKHIVRSDWVLASRNVSTTKTEGQNAFGAKTPLTIVHVAEIVLRGQRIFPDFRPGGDGDQFVARVPLEPEVAREVSKHVAWVVTGTLVRRKPYSSGRDDVVAHDTTTHDATFEAPSRFITEKTVLNAQLSRATLVDTATGKSLYSVDLPAQ